MSKRVLVVDDDMSTRMVLAKVLTRDGHSVVHCGTVAAALDELRAAPFDVLLTDYVLPKSSGVELIAEAVALHPALHCVVMSGHPRASDAPSTVAWLDKPIDLEQLFAALDA